MDSTIAKHIEVTPGVCGGKPRIAGHRITVQNIAIWHERMGRSPDEIVEQFPQLTLADVHAALAYYFDHLDEINQQIEAERKIADQMAAQATSRMKSRDGDAN